jgi:hypothetical protein
MLDVIGSARAGAGSARPRHRDARHAGAAARLLRGVAWPTPTSRRRSFVSGSTGVRGLRFNHFFRDGQLHYRGGVPLSAAQTLTPVMAELGWHLQLWIDVKDLPETVPVLKSLGLPVVIDHMGRTDARAGTATQGFQSSRRSARAGASQAVGLIVSAATHLTIPTQRPFHEALVSASRNGWCGRRLAASARRSEMPDAGHLFELFQLGRRIRWCSIASSSPIRPNSMVSN